MVEGDAEGGGGGDVANGPLDGRTNRGSTPDDDERQPMAHTTRPSMPLALYSVKGYKSSGSTHQGRSKTDSKSGHVARGGVSPPLVPQ